MLKFSNLRAWTERNRPASREIFKQADERPSARLNRTLTLSTVTEFWIVTEFWSAGYSSYSPLYLL